jgi:hypothetical protein
MNSPRISLLLLAVIAGTVFSQTQTVAITGRVTDPNGKPLTNTLVRMGVGLLYTTTDSNGYYSLGGTVNVTKPAATQQGTAFSQPSLVAGRVLFSLPKNGMQVHMSMYDLGGRFIKDVIDGKMAQGNYAVSAESQNISRQFYIIRLSIDGVSHVMKLSSVACGGNATSAKWGASMPETRLEKLAAVMDTLHATEPAYSLGIMPIQALTGTYNFTLTKTSTWNRDTAAFWGDTSKLKKAAGKIWCTFINRTNGALADSQIYWCLGDFGKPIRLSDSSTIDITNSTAGRLYVMLGYKPALPPDTSRPGNAVWDWEEHTCGNGGYNGNLTRVDAFGTPLSIRLHCADGYDAARGEIYDVFYEPRQAIFDEYANEVPYQFTDQATIQAPYRIPDPGMTPNFSTGGLYAHYWDAYQATVGITAGPYCGINDPVKSSGLHRHTCELPLAQAQNDKYHYLKAPCNFYSYFFHRRAIARKQYGFPYDDCYGFSSFIAHGNAQWLIIAVGY